MNVADNVFGADFSLCRPFHVLNLRAGHVQVLKLLLRNSVGGTTQVGLDLLSGAALIGLPGRLFALAMGSSMRRGVLLLWVFFGLPSREPSQRCRHQDFRYAEPLFRICGARKSIKQVLSAPGSPWQRAFVERLIGSTRRECLDHVIVCGDPTYHQGWRTYLSLGKDVPSGRLVQSQACGH